MQAGGAHRLTLIAVPVVIAALLTVALPAPAARAAGPYLTGHAGGIVGCFDPLVEEDDSNCREHHEGSEPVGVAADWEASRELSLAVAGAAMAGGYEVAAHEQDAPDGLFSSMTLETTVESSLTGGEGRADFFTTISPNLVVSSDTVSLVGRATVEAHGTAFAQSEARVSVEISCGGESRTTEDVRVTGGSSTGEADREDDASVSAPIEFEVPVVERHFAAGSASFCTLVVTVSANSQATQTLPPTDLTTAKATLSLTISAGPPTCALSGIVRDGNQATDGHANPLVGVLVDLIQDGDPVTDATATDGDGRYCLRSAAASPDAGEFAVRARLMDRLYDPPLFHTEHASAPTAVGIEVPITVDDFDRDDLDIEFTRTADRPWLADVANIHWQSARFFYWAMDTLQLDPGALAGLTIRAFDQEPGSAEYRSGSKTVLIHPQLSVYSQRDTALSAGPENLEWHEIAHHIGEHLGIAPTTAPECQGILPTGFDHYGGWSHQTSCPALAEGFAIFLSTLGSQDLDAARGGGYGTSQYAGVLDLEGNLYAPFTKNGPQYREHFAVAQLLWDLADETPGESVQKLVAAVAGGTTRFVPLADRVSLGGAFLVRLLGEVRPATVADLYDRVTSSAAVSLALRSKDLDLDEDDSFDVSPLDEVFILHHVHPLRAPGAAWVVGDLIGRTPPGESGTVSDRRAVESIPGSAIRLVNGGSAPATFTVEIGGEGDPTTFEIPVAAGSERLLDLELPPYWTGVLPDDSALPACGAADQVLVTLAVSAPGASTQTTDSCQYLHAVRTATDGAAMAVEVAGGGPAPTTETGATNAPGPTDGPAPTNGPSTPAPSADGGLPVVAMVGAAVLLLVVFGTVAFVTLRRRRV